MNKVWLDDDAILGQAALYVLHPGDLRECDVDVYLFLPRVQCGMSGEHRGQRGCLGEAVTVTAAKDCRPGQWASETGFADFAVAHECGGRAEEAVIVQSLDDRDAGVGTCIVGGRGDQGKSVVEVGDVGPRV